MRLGSLAFVCIVAMAALLACRGERGGDPTVLPIHEDIGGDFAAESSLGRELRLSEFRGKAVFLFFGYTSCQDVCPATLGHLKALLEPMGPDAERVQVLLVTVDPENDTPENLKRYLASFDPGFIGLTGSREETDRIAKLFMVKHSQSHGVELTTEHNRHKSPVEDSYLYSHSQQIYLLDKRGRTRALFFVGSPLDEMREAVWALLENPLDLPHAAGVERASGKTTDEQNHHPKREGDQR